ncbi:MAG: dTDP-4-dehydrorhamnose 3,5-epimerase [Bacteroidia bacterium]|nr:dTDP-4-dehydrorhamnose 3,5-epimerase [Bacteroidia bacterium]
MSFTENTSAFSRVGKVLSFSETFRQSALEDFLGFKVNFCQENESKSVKGVLRGLHYQMAPFAQSKLVRVIKGSVLDVALDIRKESPTFGQFDVVELNETNKKQLFIPKGFAHGFVVLSDEVIFSYKVDNYYNPGAERGILYNDNTLSIDWILNDDQLLLSEKDKTLPTLENAEVFSVNDISFE